MRLIAGIVLMIVALIGCDGRGKQEVDTAASDSAALVEPIIEPDTSISPDTTMVEGHGHANKGRKP